MGCTLFWGEIRPCINLFCGFGILARWRYYPINSYFDCKTRLCLKFLAGKRKYIFFAQESFYLQGILSDINEQDTSFLHCKHKHMIKSGAPPDKFEVLYRMFTCRIP